MVNWWRPNFPNMILSFRPAKLDGLLMSIDSMHATNIYHTTYMEHNQQNALHNILEISNTITHLHTTVCAGIHSRVKNISG